MATSHRRGFLGRRFTGGIRDDGHTSQMRRIRLTQISSPNFFPVASFWLPIALLECPQDLTRGREGGAALSDYLTRTWRTNGALLRLGDTARNRYWDPYLDEEES